VLLPFYLPKILFTAIQYRAEDSAYYDNFAFAFSDAMAAVLEGEGEDPIGTLVDADGNVVGGNDDLDRLLTLRNPFDFEFTARLEKGKTYYLLADTYLDVSDGYLVTPVFASF
jgi:hypothetical protein